MCSACNCCGQRCSGLLCRASIDVCGHQSCVGERHAVAWAGSGSGAFGDVFGGRHTAEPEAPSLDASEAALLLLDHRLASVGKSPGRSWVIRLPRTGSTLGGGLASPSRWVSGGMGLGSRMRFGLSMFREPERCPPTFFAVAPSGVRFLRSMAALCRHLTAAVLATAHKNVPAASHGEHMGWMLSDARRMLQRCGASHEATVWLYSGVSVHA